MRLLNWQEYLGKQWPIGAHVSLISRSLLQISVRGRSFGLDKSKAGLEGGIFQWLVSFPSSI